MKLDKSMAMATQFKVGRDVLVVRCGELGDRLREYVGGGGDYVVSVSIAPNQSKIDFAQNPEMLGSIVMFSTYKRKDEAVLLYKQLVAEYKVDLRIIEEL